MLVAAWEQAACGLVGVVADPQGAQVGAPAKQPLLAEAGVVVAGAVSVGCVKGRALE